MMTTIVFEVDGIFFNQSEELKRKLWQHLGLDDLSIAEDIMYSGHLWDTYIRGGMAEEEFWVKVIERLPFVYKGSWLTLCRLFERTVWIDTELVTIVEMLRKNYSIYALANGGLEIERRIQHFGMVDLFNKVLTSHNIKMAKPDKEIYQYTCNVINAKPEEILYVEINNDNAQAAKAIGCQSYVFKTAQSFQRFFNHNNMDLEILRFG